MRSHPFLNVTVGGAPVNDVFYSRLVSATITDAAGQDGDTVELTFDDAGNQIALPPEGAKLAVTFGFKGAGAFAMGEFVIERSTIMGGPGGELVKLSGRAADMRGDIKEPASEHFDDQTLGDIVSELAERHGYKAKVGDRFTSMQLGYVARVSQSPVDFLTRLADRVGALFAVKAGTFIFVERGALPAVTIARAEVESWSMSIEPRPRFGEIEAGWFDRASGETKFERHSTGLEGPVKRLRTTYQTADEAKAAAQSTGGELSRATGSGSITLAGMPEAMADTPIQLVGFRPEMNGAWRAETVTHTYDATYTTTIRLEAPEEGKSA